MFADGALVVAVSQMDTGGVSPWDDLVGYGRLIERKRDELTAALGTGAGVVGRHLHFVAADPEEAGRTDDPGPEDYTVGKPGTASSRCVPTCSRWPGGSRSCGVVPASGTGAGSVTGRGSARPRSSSASSGSSTRPAAARR